MSLFGKNTETKQMTGVRDFEYLDPNALYFDSACQTLRPEPVIKAEMEYYQEFNACGGRVKYEWGEKVDASVNETRQKLLDLLKLSDSDYTVAFTLNTSYGLNLLLSQLPNAYNAVITSEIEHNSVFLPTITLAKRLAVNRKVLKRSDDGELIYEQADLANAIVVLNAVSNIDGRSLVNLDTIINDTHKQDGLVILDIAQTMAHDLPLIQGKKIDAACGSVHKMYGPSLGFIVVKKELAKKLNYSFIGGGTVSDVQADTYELLDEPDLFARLEPGLQNFAGIVGFNKAIDWLQEYKPEELNLQEHQAKLSEAAFDVLSKIPSVHLTRTKPAAIMSFYSDKIDSNRLAIYLSQQKIMVRSGYFCCHYFLREVKNLPPLLRFSIGAYNTLEQVQKATQIVQQIINNS